MNKFRTGCAITAAALSLTACGHATTSAQMTRNLDAVRTMVAQGSLMAAQAACSKDSTRSDLIRGATALLRRATSGPEMTQIHKMMRNMNMQTSSTGAAMAALSPQQRLHVAVHAAGGDAFNLLDAMTQPGGPSCGQLAPVSLAASAALLRQWHEDGNGAATQMLDQEVDRAAGLLGGDVKPLLTQTTPDVVRELAVVLQRI